MRKNMSIHSPKEKKWRTTIFSITIKSRLLLAALFVVWRFLADPYDTSAELNSPCNSKISNWTSVKEERNYWGQRLGQVIERTIVWDGVYYVKIAECGYEYEQAHAFLPVFPLLMRFVSHTVLAKLIPHIGLRATLALSGYLINNILFVFAAHNLYQLTVTLLEDDKLAITAVALFCFNPASTFYSAIYSESLFAFFSFTGLVLFVKGAKWSSIIFFGLSSGVRSNGILHAGFFLFQALHKAFNLVFHQKNILAGVLTILVSLVQSSAVAAPFVAFQYYGFSQLCQDKTREIRPWCKSSLPYLYGFVQSNYWDVGLLRYFQFKQLPNFLLASPMLGLAICAVVTYARQDPQLFFSLGFSASSSIQAKAALFNKVDEEKLGLFRGEGKSSSKREGAERAKKPRKGFFSPAAICFLVQLSFMTAVAMFVMHVQVATRFLSVSPPVYWYGAHLLLNSGGRGKIGMLIWSSFLCYVSVGSLLFINFYPFT